MTISNPASALRRAAAALCAGAFLASIPSSASARPTSAGDPSWGVGAPHEHAAHDGEEAAHVGVQGYWLGTLDLGAAKLRLAFHIDPAEGGGWSATMDSIDQGAFGLEVDSVVYAEGNLELKASKLGVTVSGAVDEAAGSFKGTFKQGPVDTEFSMLRGHAEADYSRPQDPKEPFPYAAEEVSVPNAKAEGVTLAGTLLLPKSDKPVAAVIFVSGSGPQNRNEEIFNHRPFLVMADHLTRAGIATLRYDDRGVANSTGNFAGATSHDFASDALAAVEYLRGRPEIDASRVGIVGHSEGGIVGPMVAAESSDVAFLVLLAGTGQTGAEVLRNQAAVSMRASDMSEADVILGVELQQATFAILAEEPDNDAARTRINELRLAHLEKAKATEGVSEAYLSQLGENPDGLDAVLSPWFRSFLHYDPLTALRKVKVPVLALNGSLDFQVVASDNLPLIEQALRESGNDRVKAIELPGLNHLFQTAETGFIDEYPTIDETVSPAALEAMTSWIVETTNELAAKK